MNISAGKYRVTGIATRDSLKNLEKLNSTKMMKKNFIYSLCILLCGAIFMSSCEDMLEVDSDRVEYDMSPLTLNDTVYSVLGILKKVQAVADRQVLLGELRGDLMVVNQEYATTDIQKISRFEFDDNNKYLNVKDYYAIINNCNIYLARVDTTLSHNNVKLMLREYVAVKSIRAWTYLQLATNYEKVPYFTEPILTHSLSQEISERPLLGLNEIADALIEDLTPFADPRQYPMPRFTGVSNDDYKIDTELYFMPIRQLLGDLYLWKKDYKNAINCYYNLIVDNQYVMNGSGNRANWNSDEVKATEKPSGTYAPLTSYDKKNTMALASFASSTEDGAVSELPLLFQGDAVVGSHQVAAAPGLTGLSKRQTYYHAKGNDAISAIVTKNPSSDKPGDVRIYKYLSETTNRETGINYEGCIDKFGTGSYIKAIKFGRPVQAYLRLAEALAGLANEAPISVTVGDGVPYESSWENAENIAMYILRFGLGQKTFETGNKGKHAGLDKALLAEVEKGIYTIRRRLSDTAETNVLPVYETDPETGEELIDPETGEKIPVYKTNPETGEFLLDEEGNKIPATITHTVYTWNYDDIILDFSNSVFKGNMGIHYFGSGDVEWDQSLSFENDSIMATYLSLAQKENPDTTWVKNEDGTTFIDELTGDSVVASIDLYDVTRDDKIKYLRNIILDECALETSLEGYRFTDLIRFAEAMNDNDVLAKRVASRAYENKVSIYYDNSKEVYDMDGILVQFESDDEVYQKASNKANWYLPLK